MKIKILLATLTLNFIAFGQTTFSDIHPILVKNCGSCHRDGGGAPFDILDYNKAVLWQGLIQHEINKGSMPPWQADTSYMRFVGEREITEADKNAIIAWIADGALQGEDTLETASSLFPSSLLNGNPDLVLSMPTFQSNANGWDAYNTVVIPSGLTESKIIRAMEIVPENPEFTHHVIVNADEGGKFQNDFTGEAFNLKGNIGIGTYAPGANPTIYPNSDEIKLGVEIPAGADIILQVHTPDRYSEGATFGKDVNLKVKFFFFDKDVKDEVRIVDNIVPLQYWESDFYIMAGEKKAFETEMDLNLYTQEPLSVFSCFPHSHMICTDIINYAYKGTDTIPLIRIDGWDFEHQENYYFRKMVKIPADYTLKAKHNFDNTAENHHNPNDPPVMITGGFNSDDEMIFDGFQVLPYQTGDEFINLDSILSADQLLKYDTVIEGIEEAVQLRNSYVYPNPIKEQAYIYFTYQNTNWQAYQLDVFNIEGKKIQMDYDIEFGKIRIENNDQVFGTYIYQIRENNQLISSGKLLFQ